MTAKDIQTVKTTIRICLACDDKFTVHCAQTIASVISNHKTEEKLEFYVLNSSISDKNIKRLKKMNKKDSVEIFPYRVDSSLFKDCPVPEYMCYSQEAYYRLSIPEIFPDFDKMIYLDSDISVVGEINELWNLDVSDYYIAASKDISEPSHLDEFMDKSLYFNSGVMVINCKKWREDKIFYKSMEFVKNHSDSIIYVEQDVLNSLLAHKVLRFGHSWNYEYTPLINPEINSCNEDEIKLFHYIESQKPWNTYKHLYASHYFKYLSQTPWSFEIPKIKLMMFIKHLFEPFILYMQNVKCRKKLEKAVQNRRAVIWGASLFIVKIIEKFGLNTDNIIGIIDVDPEKTGRKIGKYEIFSPDDLMKLKPNLIVSAVLSKPMMKKNISAVLEKSGLSIEINDKLFKKTGAY